MTKWRIKKVSCSSYKYYVLQKRLLGFLWWYNPDNIDGTTTGIYATRSEAEWAHARKLEPVITTYTDI